MKTDPRVDAFIADAAPFARPILNELRAMIHRALPNAREDIKWGVPHFVVEGKNVVGMNAFKAHCGLGIHGRESGEGMGPYRRIESLDDLPDEAELTKVLLASAARETRGAAAKRAPKPELPMPEDLAQALKGNAAAKRTLEGFAPSHRREYLEWITDAKRPETRARRIAQAVEWLADGKKRNWKYENC